MDPVVFCTECGKDIDFLESLKVTCTCGANAIGSWILDPTPCNESLLFQMMVFSNNIIAIGLKNKDNKSLHVFRDSSYKFKAYSHEDDK